MDTGSMHVFHIDSVWSTTNCTGPQQATVSRYHTVAFSKRGGVAPRQISLRLSCDRAIRKMAWAPMVLESLANRLLSWLVARLVAMLERKPGHMYLSIRFNHPAEVCSQSMESCQQVI